jgi:hypothetical protein
MSKFILPGGDRNDDAKGNWGKEIGTNDQDRTGFLDFLTTGGVEIDELDFATLRVQHQETPSLRYLRQQIR